MGEMVCQMEMVGQAVVMRRLQRKFISKFFIFCLRGVLLNLCFLCSGAPGNSIPARRPAEVTMNDEAGRGGLLIVTVRSESGDEWPVVLDTGCAKTGFDRSIEAKLGKSIGTETFRNFGEGHQGSLYAAPRLYLGGVLLQMSSGSVGTYDCRGVSSFAGRQIMGLLGMDILRNYCVQFDFKARRIRFLDNEHANKEGWGRPFPLIDAGDGCFYTEQNLSGVRGEGSLIDTGSLHDGWLRPDSYDIWTNLTESPADGESRCPAGVLGGESYPELDVEKLDDNSLASHDLHTRFNGIGIQFLSLHLVTLDFPKRIMYLKRTAEISGYTSAEIFLKGLRETGQLPGWSKNAEIAPRHELLHFHYPNSATFDGQKIGDAFTYHYSVYRASESSGWTLQRAWRTDPSGRTNEELSVR